MQGYGTPGAIYLAYVLKILLYVGGWAFFCGSSPALGGPARFASWWLSPIAFEKAIVWSLLFEVLASAAAAGRSPAATSRRSAAFSTSCGRGTTKLPLFPGLPILGGQRRAVARRRPLCGAPDRGSPRAHRAGPGLHRLCGHRGPGGAAGRRRQDALPRRARRALLGRRSSASPSPATGSPARRPCSSRSGSGPASPSSTTTSRASSAS